MDRLVAMLRAAGDPTRLRLLLLLRQAELTVSELVEIVGQSQPRVSRHLKLLGEAGLLERFKEGSWVFYRAADRGKGAELGAALAALADPESAGKPTPCGWPHVRKARAAAAAAYFRANAAGMGAHPRPACARKKMWKPPSSSALTARPDRKSAGCRHRHRPDAGIAQRPHVKRAVGVDVSPEMLAIARDRLLRENLRHAQVRLADTYRLPFRGGRMCSTPCCFTRCCIIWTIRAPRWRRPPA